MFINDFFHSCDKNTSYFIKKCLAIGFLLNGSRHKYPVEYRIRYNDQVINGTCENSFFIFMYVLSHMKNNNMLNYDIDLSWFNSREYSITSQTKEILDRILVQKERIDLGELDYAFYNTPIGSYIRAYSQYGKNIISLERILEGFLLLERFDKEYYGIPKSFRSELWKAAHEKEANPNIIRYGSSSDLLHLPFGNLITSTEFEFDPLIGREKELRKLQAFLMDEEKSVIIYGNPGTGKTALVKGLAYDIQHGNVPDKIKNKKIVEMSASELISGCRYVGMVEERLLNIINTLIAAKNSILFIDEFHTLMGLGQGANSNNDVSNILKPYLGDGRLKIVGATTLEEYRLIKENGAFSRRFNNLELSDLTDEEILNILNVNVDRFKTKLGISLADDEERKAVLLNEILALSKQAISDPKLQRYNPDFSLSLLRLCYNFAALDGKECIGPEYVIEGINNSDSISDEMKAHFSERVLKI